MSDEKQEKPIVLRTWRIRTIDEFLQLLNPGDEKIWMPEPPPESNTVGELPTS